uniref:Uncharacterized protein n=2 Tax=Macaca TaxID=9539 RepID=A0A2K6B3I1_MACNE|nr:unnamed protein product [Macaca fascicularis]
MICQRKMVVTMEIGSEGALLRCGLPLPFEVLELLFSSGSCGQTIGMHVCVWWSDCLWMTGPGY